MGVLFSFQVVGPAAGDGLAGKAPLLAYPRATHNLAQRQQPVQSRYTPST